jgi:hypothetical protein
MCPDFIEWQSRLRKFPSTTNDSGDVTPSTALFQSSTSANMAVADLFDKNATTFHQWLMTLSLTRKDTGYQTTAVSVMHNTALFTKLANMTIKDIAHLVIIIIAGIILVVAVAVIILIIRSRWHSSRIPCNRPIEENETEHVSSKLETEVTPTYQHEENHVSSASLCTYNNVRQAATSVLNSPSSTSSFSPQARLSQPLLGKSVINLSSTDTYPLTADEISSDSTTPKR